MSDSESQSAVLAVKEVHDLSCEFDDNLHAESNLCIEDILDRRRHSDVAVLLKELLTVEVEFRQSRGEILTVGDYRRRFTSHSELIDGLFDSFHPTFTAPHSRFTQDVDTTVSSCTSTGDKQSERVGQFELLRMIGEGGMGIVFRARDVRLNREVALKLVHESADHSDAAMRFVAEAQITGQLQHPAIPAVYELGEFRDGRSFMAMKLIKGETLEDLMRKQREGSVNAEEELSTASLRGRLIAVFEQICQAIGYAHSRRVIHRDLKPANVMVGAFGEVQVMDWGLAKVLPPTGTAPIVDKSAAKDATAIAMSAIKTPATDSGTQAGSVMGTLAYIAPEQAGGEIHKLDPRSDVFGLGAILCRILTGQSPYRGKNADEVRLQAMRGEMDEAFALLNECGSEPDLVALCRRCLSFRREGRPEDGAEVAAEVARIRQETEERAVHAERERSETLIRETEVAKRRRLFVAATSVVVAILAIGVVGTAWGWFEAGRSRDAETARAESEHLAKVDAEDQKHEATRQRQMAEGREREANLLLAEIYFDRGRALCENGEPGRGMLWMARGLQVLPAVPSSRSDGLAHALRSNLAAWESQISTLRSVRRHKEAVDCVAYSPYGKTVLTGVADTAQLWDAATGKPIGSPLSHTDRVVAVAYSTDGKTILTGSRDKTARLWDAVTGNSIGVPLRHEDAVLAVAFGRDSKTVLTGSLHRIARWNRVTGKPAGTPFFHKYEVHAIAFSPDGKTVVTSRNNTAQLWNTITGKPIGHPMPHPEHVEAVAFSPDSKSVLTGSRDNIARLWDAVTGKPIGVPMRHTPRSRDAVWGFPIGDAEGVVAVVFSPDGKTVLTGSDDKTAQLWDAKTGQPIGFPLRHSGGVRAVAFSHDGRTFITGTADKTARVWDAGTGKTNLRLREFRNGVLAVAISPDGNTVVALPERGVHLVDEATHRTIGSIGHRYHVSFVAISPDGKTILTASRDTAWLLDAVTGKPIGQVSGGPRGWIRTGAFSPDGKTVITSNGETTQLHDATTGKPIGSPMYHFQRIVAVAISPVKRAITSNGETVQLWDTTTGKMIGRPLPYLARLGGAPKIPLPLEKAGKVTMVLMGSDDGTARVWCEPFGIRIGAPMRHVGKVRAAAFSPDGKTVLTRFFAHFNG